MERRRSAHAAGAHAATHSAARRAGPSGGVYALPTTAVTHSAEGLHLRWHCLQSRSRRAPCAASRRSSTRPSSRSPHPKRQPACLPPVRSAPQNKRCATVSVASPTAARGVAAAIVGVATPFRSTGSYECWRCNDRHWKQVDPILQSFIKQRFSRANSPDPLSAPPVRPQSAALADCGRASGLFSECVCVRPAVGWLCARFCVSICAPACVYALERVCSGGELSRQPKLQRIPPSFPPSPPPPMRRHNGRCLAR
jgi:hypothetical protein